MAPGSPIGVFDSGLGGLTVLKELVSALPNENFVYLGDVARLPYGTKSPGVVTRYAERCLAFLLAKGVKMVVIACNTATANALPKLRSESPVEVLGVIEPGVRAAIQASRGKRVLVLATNSTVRSEAYPKEFVAAGSEVIVEQLACPLFVPLAEEGWFDHSVTVAVAKQYLESRDLSAFDVAVMGCTHYPLLEVPLQEVLGSQIALVHGGRILAQEIGERLAATGQRNGAAAPGTLSFYSTDIIPSGLPLVTKLFGPQTSFELVDIE